MKRAPWAMATTTTPPPEATLRRAILNWSGSFLLQSATNVLGPYTNVERGPVLTGPYTNAISGSQLYFRLGQ